MTMQGRKIPQGTAVPEVMYVKKIQLATNIAIFDCRKLFPSVMKIFKTSDYLEKNKVAKR
jgi:hypothetical protein